MAYAIRHRKPRFSWKSSLTSDRAVSYLKNISLKSFHEQNAILTNYFVKGAPGFLLANINPIKGLSNGTAVILHSLELDDREDAENICYQLTCTSEYEISFKFPPKHILVEVPGVDPQKFENCTVVNGKVVIPLEANKKTFEAKLKIPYVNIRDKLSFKSHALELGFAITVHKVQGKTCDKIILDLNDRPFKPKINFHALYVALSRVKNSKNIRLMPVQPGKFDLSHLEKLAPPTKLTQW